MILTKKLLIYAFEFINQFNKRTEIIISKKFKKSVMISKKIEKFVL